MIKKYIFYLYWHEDEYIEYELDETEKDEMSHMQMNNDIAFNIFWNSDHCVREKWINWKMIYKNIFLLKQRRENPDYKSLYKREWVMSKTALYYKWQEWNT